MKKSRGQIEGNTVPLRSSERDAIPQHHTALLGGRWGMQDRLN